MIAYVSKIMAKNIFEFMNIAHFDTLKANTKACSIGSVIRQNELSLYHIIDMYKHKLIYRYT